MNTTMAVAAVLTLGLQSAAAAQSAGPAPARLQPSQQPGALVGRVRATPDSLPISGARVQVADRLGEAHTDASGRFALPLSPGPHDLLVQAIGFRPRRLQGIQVGRGDTTSVTVDLEPAPVRLSEIVVTPSSFGILQREDLSGVQALTREQVRSQPHFGEDVYRAVNRLPGIATHDIKVKLHIRGSPDDQVLQTLDGLELYEPFHLRDIDGGLSIVDVESVEDVELSTGGFGAEHGDRLAGVFAMRTTTPPPGETATTVGLSFMNLTFKSEGSFSSGRGTWLASARRGYLDIVLRLMEDSSRISPRYYDVFSKVQYQLGPGHLVSAHVLHAGDAWSGTDDDDWTEVESDWSSSYAWVTWRADFSGSLTSTTLLAAGRLTHDRRALDWFGDRQEPRGAQNLDVRDLGDFGFFGLKQDWSLLASDGLLVRWGFDLRRGVADYDYSRRWLEYVPNTTDPTAPDFALRTDRLALARNAAGYESALYLTNRVRVASSLTAELGLRHDRQSHTGDEHLAPRVSAALQLSPTTSLRAAWGLYHQSQGVHELHVAYADTGFYPAQRAEHRVLGLEHRFPDGVSLRIEAYERRVATPRPEYLRLSGELEQVPDEDPSDRVRVQPTRSAARGIELFLRRAAGRTVAWSLSYALAVTEDRIDDNWVPRPFDQRHTARLELSYRPNPKWSASWAWQYHSGWPITATRFETITLASGTPYWRRTYGPLNGERLPPYLRLDARVARSFAVGRSTLSVFLDVFNLLGRRNLEAYDYVVQLAGGTLLVDKRPSTMLGMLPTVGARWEF